MVTTDTFENQIVSGATVALQNAGSKTVTVGDDVSADAAGGGPYTETQSSQSTDVVPQTIGTYPLVTGTSYTQPIARSAATTTTIVNASGTSPAATFTTSDDTTYRGDGSYTALLNLSNGDSQTLTQSSNGTASLSETGPVQTLLETIGLPVSAAAGDVIPVTVVRQTAAQSSPQTHDDSAAEWYPGGAAPSVPFDAITVTVKGPAASMPSACSGAGSFPNVVEVDQSETSLNLLGALTVTQQQKFDSNGLAVCRLNDNHDDRLPRDDRTPNLANGRADQSRTSVRQHQRQNTYNGSGDESQAAPVTNG